MSRRFAPTALRTPISRVRSVTETSMMFMIVMPPTSNEIADTPSVTRKIAPEIVCHKPSTMLGVTSSKSSGQPGRR